MLCTKSKSCSSKFIYNLNKIVDIEQLKELENIPSEKVKMKIPENSSHVTVMAPRITFFFFNFFPESLFKNPFLSFHLERKQPEDVTEVALSAG